MEEQIVSKRGRRYDAEFKHNAVGLVQSGRPVREVARDLGVSTWSLRDWVRRQASGCRLTEAKTPAAETPEPREHWRQRDILKNALAIVSDGNLNGAANA